MGVDAISGHPQCYNFVGWGHASGECPSDPGIKGKSKSKGKGQEKGARKAEKRSREKDEVSALEGWTVRRLCMCKESCD